MQKAAPSTISTANGPAADAARDWTREEDEPGERPGEGSARRHGTGTSVPASAADSLLSDRLILQPGLVVWMDEAGGVGAATS